MHQTEENKVSKASEKERLRKSESKATIRWHPSPSHSASCPQTVNSGQRDNRKDSVARRTDKQRKGDLNKGQPKQIEDFARSTRPLTLSSLKLQLRRFSRQLLCCKPNQTAESQLLPWRQRRPNAVEAHQEKETRIKPSNHLSRLDKPCLQPFRVNKDPEPPCLSIRFLVPSTFFPVQCFASLFFPANHCKMLTKDEQIILHPFQLLSSTSPRPFHRRSKTLSSLRKK